jgi:hypothetical protein
MTWLQILFLSVSSGPAGLARPSLIKTGSAVAPTAGIVNTGNSPKISTSDMVCTIFILKRYLLNNSDLEPAAGKIFSDQKISVLLALVFFSVNFNILGKWEQLRFFQDRAREKQPLQCSKFSGIKGFFH